MTYASEPPAMYGPDVWAPDDKARAYDDLRRRANELGFVTVGEALDWIGARKGWASGGVVRRRAPYIVGDVGIALLDNRPQ